MPRSGTRAYTACSCVAYVCCVFSSDRNLDNYLISSIDQRVVLIDHGWTFTTPHSLNEVQKYHDTAFLRSIIPHRTMFARCRWLNEHKDIIDSELKFLLSADNLQALMHRLSLFVKFVDEEVRKAGMDAVTGRRMEQALRIRAEGR